MGEQFDNACKLSELIKATNECARNVRWKSSVIAYENMALLKNYILSEELRNRTYKISPYIGFYVYEPKKRLIHATRMRDRVWQRSMRNNGLYDDLTKGFVRSNAACQVGKGPHFAIQDLTEQLRWYYQVNGTNKGWVARLDIQSYFPSTPHELAKETLRRRVRDPQFLQHTEAIIDSCKDLRTEEEIRKDPTERGVYLGSEICQLVQVANIDPIDHYLLERMHVQCYSRYNDDFVIVNSDRNHTEECFAYVEGALRDKGLKLNKNSHIHPLENGIKYLNLNIKLTETGKVLVLVNHKSISEERRKLRKLKGLLDEGRITIEDIRLHYEGWTAHKKKAHTRGMRLKMNQYYTDLFGEEPTVTL